MSVLHRTASPGRWTKHEKLLIAGTLINYVWTREKGVPARMPLECHVESRKLSGCAFHLCISSEFKWLLNIISMNLHLFVAQEYPQHLRLKNASNKTPRVLNGNLNCSRRPHIRLHSPHVSVPTAGFAKTWQILEHCSSYLNICNLCSIPS